MASILEQLELNSTFWAQLGIFAILFFLLSNLYFKPFLKLFQARHKRTIDDREAAEKLLAQAESRFEEYRKRLSDERQAAKRDYEAILLTAKKEENAILSDARDEAKRITQEALESAQRQKEQIRKELDIDVESLSRQISERLLARKE